MKPVGGAVISNTTLRDITKVADLIYFDGPLLSLYRNARKENLLFHWCDSNAELERWIAVKVIDQTLDDYLRKKIDLRSILTTPRENFVFVVDADFHGTHQIVQLISPTKLSEDYLPDKGTLYEDSPIRPARKEHEEQRIPIEGEWTFADLSDFPHLYRVLYSFVYHAETKHQTIGNRAYKPFPMRDGFSSVHFFNSLIEEMPSDARPELEALQYASPGAISFSVNLDISDRLGMVYENFKAQHDTLQKSYKAIYRYLQETKLSGADAKKTQIPRDINAQLNKLAQNLGNELNFTAFENVLARSQNGLVATKAVLAFFRRLERLYQYEKDGKMRMPIIS